MNFSMIVFLMMVGVVVIAEEEVDQHYYNTDFDKNSLFIFSSPKAARSHVRCLLGLSQCDLTAEFFKSIMPEAIGTGCEKCTEDQVQYFSEIIYLIKDDETLWQILLQKYSEEGVTEFKKALDLNLFLYSVVRKFEPALSRMIRHIKQESFTK